MNKKNIVLLSIIFIIITSYYLNKLIIKKEIQKVKDETSIVTNCNVDIKVNKNNTYEVKENMDLKYLDSVSRLIRIFPLENNYLRLDGNINKERIRIKKFKKKGLGINKIKDNIFYFYLNKDRVENESYLYNFKYVYDAGKDKIKNSDEFYYSLLGKYFQYDIENLKFKINFPEDIDLNELKVYIDNDGKEDLQSIEYTINGNVLTGQALRKINAFENIVIRTKLPNGYFIGAGYNFDILDIIYFGMPIIFTIYCYILWLKNGKNKKIKKIIQKYPPDNFNPLEVEATYKSPINQASLIIQLANKGYLKIIEISNLKEKSFEIIKLKEYDGNDELEKIFFDGLFENNRKITLEKDLKFKFYKTIMKLDNKLKKVIEDKKIIYKENKKMIKILTKFVLVMIAITFLIPGLRYGIFTEKYNNIESHLRYSSIIICQIFAVYYVLMIYQISHKIKEINIIILYALSIIFMFNIQGNEATEMLLYDHTYLYGFILNIILCFVMVTFTKNMRKRTDYGNEIFEKIEGLKYFIINCTKEELEEMILENPNYFYDILPYAYSLNLEKIWIAKFKQISIKPVDWYENINGENNIKTFINSTYKKIEETLFKDEELTKKQKLERKKE